MKQLTLNRKSHRLFGLGFVESISLPRKGVFRGVFVANHLASTDNLTKITKRQNTYERKLSKSGRNKHQNKLLKLTRLL